ncbi:MAG: gamma carbonic anhydrase family protein [Parvularculaceae bacterium]
MKPLIFAIGDKKPKIHETAFIAPGAVVCGDVEVHENASVWYGCVLRGDSNRIVVGAGSNVQDGTVIHADEPEIGGVPTLIGENALIGHKCLLHGATVEDSGFVGMHATMLDGSVVKSGGFLAAGAFLGPKKIVPAGEMWAGMPARKFRELREGEDKYALLGSAHYVEEARTHTAALQAHATALKALDEDE